MLTIRKYRIFGIALFDLISAIIGLVIILLICKKIHFPSLSNTPFIITGIVLAIPIGIVFHIIFGTNTTLNYKLGLSYKPKI